MTCPRRSLFSVRAITGFASGILIGFVVGSFHLAVLNSRIASLPDNYAEDEVPPCPPNVFDPFQSDNAYNDDIEPKANPLNLLGVGMGSLQRPRRAEDLRLGELRAMNEVESFHEYDDGDNEAERLLREKEIDKIYEIDLTAFGIKPKNKKVITNYPKYSANRKDSKVQEKTALQETNDRSKNDQNLSMDTKGLLYVGVMTAGKYITTRGKAIMHTWGPSVPGKVELFIGEGVKIDGADDDTPLNVVRLKGVDDNAYPPQKKSFMMLKYMHDQYLRGYEWFMRADDDVYVKADKLEQLLRKLNSSEPIFIGQTGLGNEEERGKLTLDHGENYCMGGPGMIFSREVLRRMVPHIGSCLRNMYTSHEDVEVSRCVSKHAGVNCVWSYQMKDLFYEHYSRRLGYIDPSEETFSNSLVDAITLHPNKNPIYQRKLHNYFLSQKIKAVQTKLRYLYRDVLLMGAFLGQSSDVEEFMLGSPPTLNRFRPYNGSDVLPWMFFSDRYHLLPPESPRRSIPTYTQVAVKDIVLQVMGMMNGNSKIRGRVIVFKRVNYGYVRVNPLFGCEYVLDLLLHYNRYRGKQVSLPVRRHAYLQQTFSRTLLYEDPSKDLVASLRNALNKARPNFLESLASRLLPRPLLAFAAYLGFGQSLPEIYYENYNPEEPADDTIESIYNFGENRNDVKRLSAVEQSKLIHINSEFTEGGGAASEPPTVNMIVALTGRFLTFQRFMTNLEKVALERNEAVSLLIMLFMPQDAKQRMEMRLTHQLIQNYNDRYPTYDIRYLPIAGQFSRGLALEVGGSQFSSDSLLFFCDVDAVFRPQFLRKCRTNTKQGVSVYYPILFSEFDPALGSSQLTSQGQRVNHYEISGSTGYWRRFGFGFLCVYQSDFTSTGGFDTSIKGWGFEDVDLFDKFVKQEKEQSTDTVPTALPMRVKEPDLVHVYHQSHCDPELSSKQMTMCQASRSSSLAPVKQLYRKWFHEHANRTYLSRNSERGDLSPRDMPIGHQNNINKGSYDT